VTVACFIKLGIKFGKEVFGSAKVSRRLRLPSTRTQRRARKRHPRMFYRCLTHGALIRDKDSIPFEGCFRTHPWVCENRSLLDHHSSRGIQTDRSIKTFPIKDEGLYQILITKQLISRQSLIRASSANQTCP